MKKRMLAVEKNNEIKSVLVKRINSLVYHLEKGNYDEDLDDATIEKIIKQLNNVKDDLDNAIGTGEENIDALSEKVEAKIKAFEKATKNSSSSRLKDASKDLLKSVDCLVNIINGGIDDSIDEAKEKKESHKQKKVNSKLSELDEIKEAFLKHQKRLEKEIILLEEDLDQINEKIMDEDNERKVNNLFKQAKALKNEIDTQNVNCASYASCYNLLKYVYDVIEEFVRAGEQAESELDRANAFLKIKQLKEVKSEPEKALPILKALKKSINKIALNTGVIDENFSVNDLAQSEISEEAKAYKETLLRKTREKKQLKKDAKELDSIEAKKEKKANKEVIKEEN